MERTKRTKRAERSERSEGKERMERMERMKRTKRAKRTKRTERMEGVGRKKKKKKFAGVSAQGRWGLRSWMQHCCWRLHEPDLSWMQQHCWVQETSVSLDERRVRVQMKRYVRNSSRVARLTAGRRPTFFYFCLRRLETGLDDFLEFGQKNSALLAVSLGKRQAGGARAGRWAEASAAWVCACSFSADQVRRPAVAADVRRERRWPARRAACAWTSTPMPAFSLTTTARWRSCVQLRRHY